MADDFKDIPGPPSHTRVESRELFSGKSASLADLTGEVVEAQKYQVTQIEEKQQRFNKIQEEVAVAKGKHDVLHGNLTVLSRQLYLVQDDVAQNETTGTKCRDDIKQILDDKKKLLSESVDITYKNRKNVDIFAKYRKKMKTFQGKMKEHSAHARLGAHIERLRDIVEEEKMKLAELSREEESICAATKQVEEDTMELVDQEEVLDEEMEVLRNNIKKERERKRSVEKEIDALYKRNAGQMARLKQQVKETRMRGLRWKEENEKLQERIINLNGQLQ